MTPFTDANKLVNILHVVPAKMHFVLRCITCFQPCGIKRSFLLQSSFFLFIDLSKAMFHSETVSRVD